MDLPSQKVDIKDTTLLQGLKLADPEFNWPCTIDMLLGMDVYHCIILPNAMDISPHLKAQHSLFGWIVSGICDSPSQQAAVHLSLHVSATVQPGDHILQAFWEIEEVETPGSHLSLDDQLVLQHYKQTTIKTQDELYQVQLPRKSAPPELGESREQAKHRLLATEKSLTRRGIWNEFREVIDDYFNLGHAETVPTADLEKPTKEVFYIPMHGVMKPTSTTTKLRAVFDASAQSSSGASLNDLLLPGVTVYAPLQDILLRFRQHRIGLTADVSKMFSSIPRIFTASCGGMQMEVTLLIVG